MGQCSLQGANGLIIESGALDGPALAVFILSYVRMARGTYLSSPSLRQMHLDIIGQRDVQLGALPAVTCLALRTVHCSGAAWHFNHLPSLQVGITAAMCRMNQLTAVQSALIIFDAWHRLASQQWQL